MSYQYAVSQQKAMKILKEKGYIGINVMMISEAMDKGLIKFYKPKTRKFPITVSLLEWAQSHFSG